jgi:hypothetical protein
VSAARSRTPHAVRPTTHHLLLLEVPPLPLSPGLASVPRRWPVSTSQGCGCATLWAVGRHTVGPCWGLGARGWGPRPGVLRRSPLSVVRNRCHELAARRCCCVKKAPVGPHGGWGMGVSHRGPTARKRPRKTARGKDRLWATARGAGAHADEVILHCVTWALALAV